MSSRQIVSDFDNTMVREHTQAALVWHYFLRNPHHEPLHRRLSRLCKLMTKWQWTRNLDTYYEILRRIPKRERQTVLSRVHVRGRWLRAVKDLRMRYKCKTASLTILTRNSIDVVHDWVMQNRNVLRDHNIVVRAIIANSPIADADISLVRQRADLTHIDYVGFGRMLQKEKRQFLDKDAIFIGDADDVQLQPFVKEFVRV